MHVSSACSPVKYGSSLVCLVSRIAFHIHRYVLESYEAMLSYQHWAIVVNRPRR